MGCRQWRNSPLVHKALGVIPEAMLNKTVAEFVDDVGQWRWHEFAHLLPECNNLRIASMMPPNRLAHRDALVWVRTSNGRFTTKSAYELLESIPLCRNHKAYRIS